LLTLLALGAATAVAGPGIGEPAPHFSIPDTAWVSRQLAEFRGQVVLLNFWTSG
jgi:peroxiredoxin